MSELGRLYALVAGVIADRDDEAISEWLPKLWTAEKREVLAVLPVGAMLDLFRRVEFVERGRPRSPRPSKPRRMYRGAPSYAARGASWTPDALDAAASAAAPGHRVHADRAVDPARLHRSLWVADVDPDAMLAHLDNSHDEYVVDPDRVGEVRAVTVDEARGPRRSRVGSHR